MRAKGRTVYRLAEKLAELARCLADAGILPDSEFHTLSHAIGENYRTLRSAETSGRVSIKIEAAICKIGNFHASDTAWVDSNMTEAQRSEVSKDYSGKDDIQDFKAHLLRIWAGIPNYLRMKGEMPWSVNPEWLSHEISDCGQATVEGSPLPIFLESDFGQFFHESGIQFGMRRVRIRLDFEEVHDWTSWRLDPIIRIGSGCYTNTNPVFGLFISPVFLG